MNGRGQTNEGTTLAVLGNVGAFLRLIASLLLLAWVIPPAPLNQHGLAHSTGQSSLAGNQPTQHSTIVARDVARQAGAEASRFKAGAYVPLVDGNGKPFGIVPVVNLSLDHASEISYDIWADDRSKRLTNRAFDARGPPVRAA